MTVCGCMPWIGQMEATVVHGLEQFKDPHQIPIKFE